jgi:DNA repair protein RadA/Sms
MPKPTSKATPVSYSCKACGQRHARWAGRCPGCGGWGTVHESAPSRSTGRGSARLGPLAAVDGEPEVRVESRIAGLDRVLGGGLVAGSVVLLAGEPGIGKSTLLLHLLGAISSAGRSCLLASGEEARRQVAARAKRLGVNAEALTFVPGRDLDEVLDAARAETPFLLAVDSIQSLRDPAGGQMPGGVAQVRICADALVGLAKELGIAVVLTGHVTKDGDLAGPRALEHAVDVVLTFEGDPRSGLRLLVGGKNRFGSEGEAAWFEMGPAGLTELDPDGLLIPRDRVSGSAVGLPLTGRRALAVDLQALVGAPSGAGRCHATGLDPRRFQLVAAVLERASGWPLGRSEIFGASPGGLRVDDPGCDLALAAALASAVSGIATPEGTAFVGELALTGLVRPVAGMASRLRAAKAAGRTVVLAPGQGTDGLEDLDVVVVRELREALGWALRPAPHAARLPA